MARVNNKLEFIEYIRRQLGHPFNKIEISPEQFDDIVDTCLLYYMENCYEGHKIVYHSLTITNIKQYEYNLREAIPNIYAVTDVIDTSYFGYLYPTTFGMTQQDIDFVFSLGKLQSGNIVDFEISMENLSAIKNVISPKMDWDFNFNTGIFRFGGSVNVKSVTENRYGLVCQVLLDYDGSGKGRYWDNKLLKEYAVALAKIQWSNNLSKFSSFNIPGGGEINWEKIGDEGRDEKKDLEEKINDTWSADPGVSGIWMA